MMFWYGGGLDWWQAGLMWFGMIVFWGLLIWGVYALVSSAIHGPRADGHDGDSRRILDERLARGEIDSDEYRRLRELISAGPSKTSVGS